LNWHRLVDIAGDFSSTRQFIEKGKIMAETESLQQQVNEKGKAMAETE
jgi:hypothetical protein